MSTLVWPTLLAMDRLAHSTLLYACTHGVGGLELYNMLIQPAAKESFIFHELHMKYESDGVV